MTSAAPPGPLAEEAARLVEAVAEWARGAVGDLPFTTAAGTAGMGSGAECQVCPVCQLIAVLRRTSPDTFGHLVDASASMMAALRTVVETHDHARRRSSGVQRIDLDSEMA